AADDLLAVPFNLVGGVGAGGGPIFSSSLLDCDDPETGGVGLPPRVPAMTTKGLGVAFSTIKKGNVAIFLPASFLTVASKITGLSWIWSLPGVPPMIPLSRSVFDTDFSQSGRLA